MAVDCGLVGFACGIWKERLRTAEEETLQASAHAGVAVSTKTAEQLRGLFEGRAAIYVEKGAAHVKVSNIRWSGDLIEAEVEEIPTAGFPWRDYPDSSPRRWTIGAS